MRSFIGSLAAGNPPVTILLTSHNLNEIEELCQRIAIISHGRIRELDTPDRIRTLHKARERVRLVLDGISIQRAVDALAPVLPEAEVLQDGPRTVITFSREVNDDRLDRGLRAVLANGTRVVSCDTQRATAGSIGGVRTRRDGEEQRAIMKQIIALLGRCRHS